MSSSSKQKLSRWPVPAIIAVLVTVPIVLFWLNRPHACRLLGRISAQPNDLICVTRSGIQVREFDAFTADRIFLYHWDGTLAWSVTLPDSTSSVNLYQAYNASQNGRFVVCAISNSPKMRILVWKDGKAQPPVLFPRPQLEPFDNTQLYITNSGRIYFWLGKRLIVIDHNRIIAENSNLPQSYELPAKSFRGILKGIQLPTGAFIRIDRYLIGDCDLIGSLFSISTKDRYSFTVHSTLPGFEMSSLTIDGQKVDLMQIQSVLCQYKGSISNLVTPNEWNPYLPIGGEFIILGTGEIYGRQGLLYPPKGSKPAWFPQLQDRSTSLQTYQLDFIPQQGTKYFYSLPTRIFYPHTGDAWLLPHNRPVSMTRIAEDGNLVAQQACLYSDNSLHLIRKVPLAGKSLSDRLGRRDAIIIFERPNRMKAVLNNLIVGGEKPQLKQGSTYYRLQDFALSPDGSYLLVNVSSDKQMNETLVYAWK